MLELKGLVPRRRHTCIGVTSDFKIFNKVRISYLEAWSVKRPVCWNHDIIEAVGNRGEKSCTPQGDVPLSRSFEQAVGGSRNLALMKGKPEDVSMSNLGGRQIYPTTRGS